MQAQEILGRKEFKVAGCYLPGMRRPGFVAVLLLQLLVLCGWGGSTAVATGLNGSWEYQLGGGDGVKTQDRFLQRYYLATGFTLQPTDALTAGANITFTRYTVTGTGTNETLSPAARRRAPSRLSTWQTPPTCW